MRTTIRVFAVIIALGIGFVSVAMTFSFGMLFADGAERFVYAGLFALLDAAKMVLPTMSACLAFKGLGGMAWRARFCYLFFAALSLSSHVGLTLTVKDGETADAKTSQLRLADATAARDSIKARISALSSLPSSGIISAELAQIERDPIFTDDKRSAGCTNDTADDSRKLCDRWRTVKGQRDDRVRLDKLVGDLDAAQAKVDAATTGSALKKANILAATLAEKTGGDEWTILLVIAILLALGIEAGSSLLLELASAVGHQSGAHSEPGRTENRVQDEPTKAEEPAEAPSCTNNDAETRQNAVENLPTSCPKSWVQSRLQPKRGARIPYDGTLALYEDEARAAGMSPASANAFSRALTDNGYERKRPSGKTMIIGAEIRADEAKTKLSVVK